MREDDRKEFAAVIRATFDNYHREMPRNETLRFWWESLKGFDMQAVRMACMAHCQTEPKFPPTLAQLTERMRPAVTDGRAGVEEAWAIAVRACDETETVMLTDEIAQAWGIAKPVMDLGDEVGARMAFKEAYARLLPPPGASVRWWPSLGSDPDKRQIALACGQAQGLLPAPAVAALLPTPVGEGVGECPDGLERLKQAMAGLRMKHEERQAEFSRRAQERREAIQAAKRDAAAKVDAYARNGTEQAAA